MSQHKWIGYQFIKKYKDGQTHRMIYQDTGNGWSLLKDEIEEHKTWRKPPEDHKP